MKNMFYSWAAPAAANTIWKSHNQNENLSKMEWENHLFVFIGYGLEHLIFEEVVAKLNKILGQMKRLLGVMSLRFCGRALIFACTLVLRYDIRTRCYWHKSVRGSIRQHPGLITSCPGWGLRLNEKIGNYTYVHHYIHQKSYTLSYTI